METTQDRSALPAGPRLKFEPVFDYEQVLVVNKAHALAKVDYAKPKDLDREVLISYPVDIDRLDIYNQFLLPAGIAPPPSEAALEEQRQEGFMGTFDRAMGGVNGWITAGQPVERGAERISLERQVRMAAGTLAATGGILALAVNPLFGLLAAFVGGGLVFAGLTDTCGMAMLLSRLPYNRPATCDVDAMVRALKSGAAPAGIGRAGAGQAPPAASCAS